jgi:multicomponent Na+:H+ antiporter subunit A
MAVAILVVVRARSRILAVSALGMVGGGAALVFLVYGAPDLALTQLLVETLTLIIVSIVLLRLPPLSGTPNTVTVSRWLDGLVAVGTGIVVAGCAWPSPMAPLIVN